MMTQRYRILIQWSDEDQVYIASQPEFSPYAHTHGSMYAEALQNAQKVLEMLIEDYQAKGRQLPQPAIAS